MAKILPGMVYPVEQEKELMITIFSPYMRENPERFITYIFPWGKKGTPLENREPRKWQLEELQSLTETIADNKDRMARGLAPKIHKVAVASGRGTGKSAFFAWLTYWMMSTNIGSTTCVAANTETQLRTKTWPELGRWHAMALNRHWFEIQSLSLKPAPWFQERVEEKPENGGLGIGCRYYYAEGMNWSEENTDSWTGTHNPYGMAVIFDEASGIHEKIWSSTDGFFTEPTLCRIWYAFSNPRRNTGAFYECFHKNRDEWKRRHIDSRSVGGLEAGMDLDHLNDIINRYGIDSDAAKIEVLGEFPSQGDKQFISRESVEAATLRELVPDEGQPLIMGVDPARYGADKSVIRFRQGRNGRIIPPSKYKGLDNMQLANQCANLIHRYNPDAICIDAGNGTGVIDRLREMGFKVHEVWFGSKADEREYANKRTELWGRMREWLKGGCIDADRDLKDDLVGPEYQFMGKSDQIVLESKEKMKARMGAASPDDADALACTFAVKPARRDLRAFRGSRRERVAKDVDYNPFGD